MSENLETLFNAARKLPLEEQRQLAEKLLEATKEFDDTQDGGEKSAARGKLRRHFGAWDSGNVRSADNGKEWSALTELLDDSAVDIDIPDLAHEHDHYLYGTPKRE